MNEHGRGGDVQKKTRFVQYLNATRTIQNRIQKESAGAQLAVINTLFDNMGDAHAAKNQRDAELTAKFKAGALDKEQFEKSLAINRKRIEEHVKRLNETADMLTTRHTELLYKTLELFKADLIQRGKL